MLTDDFLTLYNVCKGVLDGEKSRYECKIQ